LVQKKKKKTINIVKKKVIKLTESDLQKIVKRIIREERLNELGGMEDTHPKFGNVNFSELSQDEIMKLGSRDFDYEQEDEYDWSEDPNMKDFLRFSDRSEEGVGSDSVSDEEIDDYYYKEPPTSEQEFEEERRRRLMKQQGGRRSFER